MFREMRRAERQLGKEEALEILTRAEHGTLATINDDGYPYAVAINHVVMDGCIYFHCAMEGQKLDNIMREPRVCYTAVGGTQVQSEKFSTKYESAVVFGKAQVVLGDEKRSALQALVRKFASQFAQKGAESIKRSFDRTAIVRITPVHITGKAKR